MYKIKHTFPNKKYVDRLVIILSQIKNDYKVQFYDKKTLTVKEKDLELLNIHPIFEHITRNNLNKVKEIVKNNPDSLKAVYKKEKGVLLFAVKPNNINIVKYLVEKGVDINQVYQDGYNILYALTSSDKYLDLFKYFLKLGVDPKKNKNQYDILDNLMYYNSKKILKVYLSYVENIKDEELIYYIIESYFSTHYYSDKILKNFVLRNITTKKGLKLYLRYQNRKKLLKLTNCYYKKNNLPMDDFKKFFTRENHSNSIIKLMYEEKYNPKKNESYMEYEKLNNNNLLICLLFEFLKKNYKKLVCYDRYYEPDNIVLYTDFYKTCNKKKFLELKQDIEKKYLLFKKNDDLLIVKKSKLLVIKNCKFPYVFLDIMIFNKKDAHANVAIVDVKYKKIIHFEPNGRESNHLFKIFFKKEFPSYSYIPTIELCPLISSYVYRDKIPFGPQTYENFDKRFKKTRGYCNVFGLLYLCYILEYPKKTYKQIFNLMFKNKFAVSYNIRAFINVLLDHNNLKTCKKERKKMPYPILYLVYRNRNI